MMNLVTKTMLIAALAAGLMTTVAQAQCDTCGPAAVAVQPVAYQQTVAYQPYTGWYPGKLLDRMRTNRWFGGAAPAVPATYATTTAAYAPYTASYAPYSASYAPYTPYTAGYTPYLTAYAPLQRTVVARPAVQTSFYRPVVMRPVIAEPAISTCAYAEPTCCEASPCSGCSGEVSQAIYSDASSDCVGCGSGALSSSELSSEPNWSGSQSSDPPTPRPALKPEVAAPEKSLYQDEWAAGYRRGLEDARQTYDETSESDVDETLNDDPGPAEESAGDPETESGAINYPSYPPLYVPSNDRTARRPSVDIHDAVYRRTAKTSAVSRRESAKTPVRAKTQAELDAEGWAPVHRNR